MTTTCIGTLLLRSFLFTSSVESFVVTTAGRTTSFPFRRCRSTVQLFESRTAIPTIDQLSSDPFMKQIGHASGIVTLLEMENNDNESKEGEEQVKVTELLKAQLSHSDGIRGFFVTYLTGSVGSGSGDDAMMTVADKDEVPKSLVEAMNTVDSDELVPLACMNVIMPTAMKTMHEDEALAQSSAQTAQRGIKVLKVLMDKPAMKKQCEAIYKVSVGSNNDDDDKDIKYWTEFFEKWGYKQQQREDIETTMAEILSL